MRFYTYIWLRDNGIPVYVGKGQGKRAFVQQGHRVTVPKDNSLILIQEFPSEHDAFEAEKFLISYYGRMDLGTGCLANLTDGGEGPAGKRYTKEQREKKRDEKNTGRFKPGHPPTHIGTFKVGCVSPRKGKGMSAEERKIRHREANKRYRAKQKEI